MKALIKAIQMTLFFELFGLKLGELLLCPY
jgi:hypothetical protein